MRSRNELSPFHTPVPEPATLASAYPDDLNQLAAGMSDEQALKKIGQRSSTSGKFITLAVIGGAVALGWFYFQRSAAYDARMDGIIAAGKLEGDAMLAGLRAELTNSPYDDVKERAIRNLAHFKDEQAVPQLIAALDNGGIVRRASALALARIGSPAGDAAKPKLLQVLPNTDAKDRPQVVWALAVLKEPNAADAIIEVFTSGLLQSQPGFDPKVITDALGIDKLSSDELTGHKQKPVRALVAMALSEAASPKVVPPLVRIISNKDEDPEVIRAAVAGLGRAGDPSAAAPLFKLMQERPEMQQSVLDALGKSTAGPQIATLLKEAKDPSTKRDLVRLLVKTYDPRVAPALLSLVNDQDEETRIEATHGLAELGHEGAVEPLLVLARSEDDKVGNEAIDALRTMANPAAGDALLKLFEEFPYRKAAIMRALGACQVQAAGGLLVKELEGDDVGSAAKALGQMKYEPAYKTLVGMLKRDPKVDFSRPSVVTEMAYRNRYEAMQALRYFGTPDPKAAEALITIIEDPEDDFRLATAAGAALGQIADEGIYQTMLQKIADPNLEERIRVNYVQGLWRKPNPALSTQLAALMEGQNPQAIKSAAALAVGYAGNPANDAKLLALLDNAEARRFAAIAVVLGGNEEGARKLLEVLPEDRDAEDILRMAVGSNEDDNFNLLTQTMFDSGQVYRRLRVAEVLKEGTSKGSQEIAYSYIWAQATTRLRAGWDGPDGVSPRYIRDQLYKSLTGQDAERRRLAAQALSAMNLRGLLLAARDAKVEEARQVLLELDRPRTAS